MEKIVNFIYDKRIATLLVLLLLAGALIAVHGIKFGIDFSGGTRIPIVLEKAVEPQVMDEIVQNVKTRAAVFGLTEVKVQAVGDTQVYVEVASNNPKLVTDIETLLSKQGVYQAVVDGKEALRGDQIYTGTIGQVSPSATGSNADWAVQFSVTQDGAQKFSNTVKGKANYPVYMFLDRPTDSVLFVSKQDLLASTKNELRPVSEDEISTAVNDALTLENSTLKMYMIDDFDTYKDTLEPATNKTKAIISSNASKAVISALEAKGYQMDLVSDAEVQPTFSISQQKGQFSVVVEEWTAIGLLSAPRLSPQITDGVPNYGYVITGNVKSTGSQRTIDANAEAKRIESVLKGGALPVQISLGSTTSIPAPLGAEFLRLSVIGALAAVLVISLFVAIRYRTLKIILPIIGILMAEVTILVAIIGSFTIDLGAMAGIIAAIGVSVDAQILITDELLKKDTDNHQKKLDRAFSIITFNAATAVVAMLPLLLFSGLVEIIGFATTSILGSLLGVFISRPAYGAIVERLFD